jgi:hypothetical protein
MKGSRNVTTDQQPIRVSGVVRTLAWIFLCLSILGVVGWILRISREGLSFGLPLSIASGLLMLALILLIGYVAVRGRSPKWWASYEHWVSRSLGARRPPSRNDV